MTRERPWTKVLYRAPIGSINPGPSFRTFPTAELTWYAAIRSTGYQEG
jgi:hypothetical protein